VKKKQKDFGKTPIARWEKCFVKKKKSFFNGKRQKIKIWRSVRACLERHPQKKFVVLVKGGVWGNKKTRVLEEKTEEPRGGPFTRKKNANGNKREKDCIGKRIIGVLKG